jgi:hypothetical protein
MSITIEPLGGLGNQLFVYGLGLRLARELNVDLESDIWRFHDYPWHVYELDTFSNSISRTYSSPSRERYGHKARGVIRRGQSYRILPQRFGSLAIERDATFDPTLLELGDGSRLSGYFQSWKYLTPIVEELRNEISHPVSPSTWLSETRNLLSGLAEWTAVHVRRGNYTQISSMGLAEDDYYRRAIHEVDLHSGGTPLVVFSDSPELAAQMPVFDNERTTFVTNPPEVAAIDVLQVMSDAAHLVIGNSTFSWWAAYLKDRPGRTVVAPRPWLDDKSFNERDLLPTDWITLGRA